MHGTVKTIGFLSAGLVAGFAVASWLRPASPQASYGEAFSLTERVDELERQLAWEADERLELAAELATLRRELESRPALAADVPPALPDPFARIARGERPDEGEDSEDAEDSDDRGQSARLSREEREQRRREELERRRTERYIAAGFTPERVNQLEQRTEELQMAALQARYEATRNGEDPGSAPSAEQLLRTELGEDEYARFREATGRSTSVDVRDVLPSSPAQQAGLRRGDELLSYDGRRIFEMSELNQMTMEGRPGEPVSVEVMRDGQRVQVVVPRGPIGITGGGRRGRFP